MKINALVATDAAQPLSSSQIALRPLQQQDVKIEILYCGVCHSDLHMARNEWAVSRYPLVPGHEIVGRIVETGAAVDKLKAGDIVGVGVMVDSCRECHFCKQQEEQYCEAGFKATYNGIDKYTGESTWGGYAQNVVVDQDFVVSVPQHLPLAGVAPAVGRRSTDALRGRDGLVSAASLQRSGGHARWRGGSWWSGPHGR